MNLYDLEFGKRYSFLATVREFVTEEIRPKHYGAKTPDYWDKDRIILKDVKILEGNNYIEFEPIIKMDMGKQFQRTKEYDIITFDAKFGTVDPYYSNYDEDDRGKFVFKMTYLNPRNYYGNDTFLSINGTKDELIAYEENNEEEIDKLCTKHKLTSGVRCYEVRRLIYPSKVEIEDRISTDNDEDMEDYTIKVA